MRKITFLLSFFVVLGLSAQTNLVKNPSFEDDFTSWSKGPIGSYTDPTVKSGGAQDGSKYVEYITTATTGFYQEIPVTAGKTYTLSFWYKSSGDNSDTRLWSLFKNAEGGTVNLVSSADDDPLRTNNKYLPSASSWTQHTLDFVAPAGVVLFQFAVRSYSGATSSFDNFSLVEAGGTAPVLSVNPTSLSFSAVVGTPSAAQTVTVSAANLSAAPTVSVTGTDAAMFTYTGSLTAAGGDLAVVFNPSSTGSKSATMTITSGDLSATVELTGTATDASNPYGLDDSNPLTSLNEPFGDGSVTSYDLPTGWLSVALEDDRSWEVRRYNNNNYAQFTAHNGTGRYQNLLISPALNFDKIDKKNVRFDWNSGFTNGAILKVYVMAKDMTKTEVFSINDNANPSGYGTGFNTVTLDLSAYSGVKFLVFEYTGETGVATTTYQVDNVIADLASGIGSTRYQDLNLWSSNGKVMFNAVAGETVEVYNTVGQRMFNALAVDGQNEVSLNQRGIVIVKVGNRVGKVIL